MKKSTIVYIVIASILLIVGVILGIGYTKKLTENTQNPIVTINLKDYGTVKVELYPEYAPNTVANFVKLIQNGFYDGLTIHRIQADGLIQGGDINGDGTGKAAIKDLYTDSESETEYCIKGEFVANDYTDNTLKFEEGVIGMGRADYTSISSALSTQSYNSAGTQFFVVLKDSQGYNGKYCGFGKVIEGLDILKQISHLETAVETDETTGETSTTETPVDKPVMESVTVETFGRDFGYPETVEAFDYMSYLMSMYGYSY